MKLPWLGGRSPMFRSAQVTTRWRELVSLAFQVAFQGLLALLQTLSKNGQHLLQHVVPAQSLAPSKKKMWILTGTSTCHGHVSWLIYVNIRYMGHPTIMNGIHHNWYVKPLWIEWWPSPNIQLILGRTSKWAEHPFTSQFEVLEVLSHTECKQETDSKEPRTWCQQTSSGWSSFHWIWLPLVSYFHVTSTRKLFSAERQNESLSAQSLLWGTWDMQRRNKIWLRLRWLIHERHSLRTSTWRLSQSNESCKSFKGVRWYTRCKALRRRACKNCSTGDMRLILESSICCGSDFGKWNAWNTWNTWNTCARFRSWSDMKLGRLQLEDLFILEAMMLRRCHHGLSWCSCDGEEASTLIGTQRECHSTNAGDLCCLRRVGVFHTAAIEDEEIRTHLRQVACPKVLFLEVIAQAADRQISWLLQRNNLIPLFIKISIPVVGNAKHAWLSSKQVANINAHEEIGGEQPKDFPVDLSDGQDWARPWKIWTPSASCIELKPTTRGIWCGIGVFLRTRTCLWHWSCQRPHAASEKSRPCFLSNISWKSGTHQWRSTWYGQKWHVRGCKCHLGASPASRVCLHKRWIWEPS